MVKTPVSDNFSAGKGLVQEQLDLLQGLFRQTMGQAEPVQIPLQRTRLEAGVRIEELTKSGVYCVDAITPIQSDWRKSS